MNLTPEQLAWLVKHPEYSPIGNKPRPGTRFEGIGTLHDDGMFELTVPVQPGLPVKDRGQAAPGRHEHRVRDIAASNP